MRTVPEWVGASDDTPIPDRVRLRIFLRTDGKCAECGNKIGEGRKWQIDHIIALSNGGPHSESNMQALCQACHGLKTSLDVAQKAFTYQKRKASAGIKQSRNPMPGSRISKWKKKMDGTVVRR